MTVARDSAFLQKFISSLKIPVLFDKPRGIETSGFVVVQLLKSEIVVVYLDYTQLFSKSLSEDVFLSQDGLLLRSVELVIQVNLDVVSDTRGVVQCHNDLAVTSELIDDVAEDVHAQILVAFRQY